MKAMPVATLCAVTFVVAMAQCVAPTNRPAANDRRSSAQSACGSELDLSNELRVLSTDNREQVDRARDALLQHAGNSEQCRTEIINELIRSMNKPDLNFVTDRPAYFLWSNGSILLGRLRAVEALDLLISHLDANDGLFSASMKHQPAVPGVMAMGSAALPKLTVALKENQNPNIRLAVALCLNDIGGASIQPTFADALKSESDSCVRQFLETAIELSKLKEVAKPGESIEKEGELRRRLLIATRCRNQG